jgi:hypothetical protein
MRYKIGTLSNYLSQFWVFALYIVITLPTLRYPKLLLFFPVLIFLFWFCTFIRMASFLYCSPNSYQNSWRFFLAPKVDKDKFPLLFAIAAFQEQFASISWVHQYYFRILLTDRVKDRRKHWTFEVFLKPYINF